MEDTAKWLATRFEPVGEVILGRSISLFCANKTLAGNITGGLIQLWKISVKRMVR